MDMRILIGLIAGTGAICLLYTNNKLNKIMATLQELSAKVDELQSTVDAEQEQIKAAIDALNETNAALQAIIDAGGGDNSAAIQAIMDKVESIKTDLAGTIPDAPPPPPEG